MPGAARAHRGSVLFSDSQAAMARDSRAIPTCHHDKVTNQSACQACPMNSHARGSQARVGVLVRAPSVCRSGSLGMREPVTCHLDMYNTFHLHPRGLSGGS